MARTNDSAERLEPSCIKPVTYRQRVWRVQLGVPCSLPSYSTNQAGDWHNAGRVGVLSCSRSCRRRGQGGRGARRRVVGIGHHEPNQARTRTAPDVRLVLPTAHTPGEGRTLYIRTSQPLLQPSIELFHLKQRTNRPASPGTPHLLRPGPGPTPLSAHDNADTTSSPTAQVSGGHSRRKI